MQYFVGLYMMNIDVVTVSGCLIFPEIIELCFYFARFSSFMDIRLLPISR
jgi:hypothetical protein